ncbi:hypothetical protein B0H19DRAFT_1336233 [Mycena capillaripes]|nr:hypothetical protein B0H19DRAFT_1336233 [Mycena capillaripes]
MTSLTISGRGVKKSDEWISRLKRSQAQGNTRIRRPRRISAISLGGPTGDFHNVLADVAVVLLDLACNTKLSTNCEMSRLAMEMVLNGTAESIVFRQYTLNFEGLKEDFGGCSLFKFSGALSRGSVCQRGSLAIFFAGCSPESQIRDFKEINLWEVPPEWRESMDSPTKTAFHITLNSPGFPTSPPPSVRWVPYLPSRIFHLGRLETKRTSNPTKPNEPLTWTHDLLHASLDILKAVRSVKKTDEMGLYQWFAPCLSASHSHFSSPTISKTALSSSSSNTNSTAKDLDGGITGVEEMEKGH